MRTVGRSRLSSGNMECFLPDFLSITYVLFLFCFVSLFLKITLRCVCHVISPYREAPREISRSKSCLQAVLYDTGCVAKTAAALSFYGKLWGGQCMNLVTGAGHSLFSGNGVLPRGRLLQTSLLLGGVCYAVHQSQRAEEDLEGFCSSWQSLTCS